MRIKFSLSISLFFTLLFLLSEQPLTAGIICLVRHGESEGNRQHLLQGWLDFPLSDKGKEQAALIGKYLLEQPEQIAPVVYSSDLRRAAETAEIIAQECGLLVAPGKKGLREYDMGQAQGVTKSKVATHFSKEISFYDSLSKEEKWNLTCIPGAESPQEIINRAIPDLKKIALIHPDQTIIIVAHGRMMRTLMDHAIRDPHKKHKTPNCCIATFLVDEEGIKFISLESPLELIKL